MNSHAYRRLWIGSASCSAIVMAASLAQAQAAPAQASSPAQAAANQPAVQPQLAAQAGRGGTQLEEVTVTARKREERLIDVPVAAQVLGAATINRYNTTDLIQLPTISTGVFITRTGGGTPGASVYIRGIGVFGPDYASESPVAFVVDGVPVTRGHLVDTGFFDLANIQILKGPQSLFFGKDSPAGVIAINSASPGDKFEGYARASYGFYAQDPQFEAAVSIPIVPTFSIRLALRLEDMQGGYFQNQAVKIPVDPVPDPFFGGVPTATGGPSYKNYPQTKEITERFTAVWKPIPQFDATFKVFGSYYHNDSPTGQQGYARCDNGVHPFYVGALGGAYEDVNAACRVAQPNDAVPPAPVLSAYVGAPGDGKYYTLTQNFLASTTVNYRLPWVTFTAVSGYLHLKASEFGNYDSTNFAETPDYQNEDTSIYTEELRAATNFNLPVNFTVGGFYEHEQRYLYNTNRIFLLGPLPAGLTGQQNYAGASNSMIGYDNNRSEDFSFFGQFDWKILPNLELAGGGRWTDAHKHSTLTQLEQALDQLYGPYPVAQMFSSLTPAGTVYDIRTKYQNFSPEVTLTYHFLPNAMVYAAYKTGFLEGGIANPGVVTNYLVYNGGVFDPAATQSKVQNNLTFEPEKVKGAEVGVKGTLFGGRLQGDLTFFDYIYYDLQVATFHSDTTTFSIGNAGSAIDEGFEINANYQATPDLALRGSLTYVPLRYHSFPNSQCYTGQTPATGCVGGVQDLSHTDFGGPPLSINLGFTYYHPITDRYSGVLTTDVQIYNSTPLVNGAPNTSSPGYALLNMSLRLNQNGGPWSVSLIGTNLTDEQPFLVYGTKPLGEPQDLWANLLQGREIRLQLDCKF